MHFKICAHSLLPILRALLLCFLGSFSVSWNCHIEVWHHTTLFVLRCSLSFFITPSGSFINRYKLNAVGWHGVARHLYFRMLPSAFFKGYHWVSNTWIVGSNSPPSPFASVPKPFLHSPLKRLLAQVRLCESFLVIPPLKIVLLVLPSTVILLSVSEWTNNEDPMPHLSVISFQTQVMAPSWTDCPLTRDVETDVSW